MIFRDGLISTMNGLVCFRIFAGANVELGAAWQKRSEQTGNDYLSVKLDDPSFPAAIYATLTQIEGEEGYQLIWSRPTRD